MPPRFATPALTAALLLAAVPALAALSPDSARIVRMNEYVDRLAAFGFSGQIVVAERGRIVLQRAHGWADRRFAVPMTAETRLGIGSVTKSFVAAAILRLETQGKLSTGDRIGRHLPAVPPEPGAITIAQLLSHTGGMLPDVPNIPDASPRDAIVAAALAEPLIDRPGSRFHYSNAGFDVLAAIVERVSGESFGAFVRRELLAPAAMIASGTAGDAALGGGPAARGYNEWKEVSAWTEWPAGWRGTGSGRMVSTALDLWRWGEALRGGRALSAREWAKMSARHTMKQDSTAFYGFGMHLAVLAGGQTMQLIGGDVDGYRAELRIYPASDRVIVVTTNEDQFGLGVQRRVVASTLSRIAQNQPFDLPPAPRAVAVREEAEGAWQLPSGGTVEIWRENGALRLGARGQDAVDCFEPDPRDTTGARRRIGQSSETLMRAALRRDSSLALGALPRNQYDFAYPFLERRLRALDALHDGFRTAAALGIVSVPWDDEDRRAYVRLEYVDGTNDLFLGWRGANLYDVTFDEGRPFPVLYPVAPLETGRYAAYDPIRQRTIPFRVVRPSEGPARLILTSPAGEIAAKKMR